MGKEKGQKGKGRKEEKGKGIGKKGRGREEGSGKVMEE